MTALRPPVRNHFMTTVAYAASDCPKHRTTAREPKAECVCVVADFHELRHFCASLLIRHGESVKTVRARLGHASAAETLDT